MRALTLCALALGLAACASARSPGRDLYQWADAEGNVRYTSHPSQVPRGSRDTLARIEPGRSADDNALLSAGARTQPRPPPTATEWLRGEEPVPGTNTPPATPATPEEIAALDTAIHGLETEIAAAEVALADQIGASEQGAGVREAAERLPRLQAELRALRAQRAAIAPADGG